MIGRQVLSPYGRRLSGPSDPLGLAGQRLDATGLYHMGAREMHPGFGLFVTPDPSDAPDPTRTQTLNRFAYANNNPTNLIDPTGFAAQAPETGYDRFSFWAHNVLSTGGAVPAFGVVPDAVDFLSTAGELPFGKSTWTDLGLTGTGLAATFTPIGGDQIAAAAKISARTLRRAEKAHFATQVMAGAGDTTTLYRAVSKAELDDIAENGLRTIPGGYETGKLFATGLEDAAKFGQNNFKLDGLPNYLIKVDVPNNVMGDATKFRADFMDAVSIPADKLNQMNSVPLNYSPLVR